MSDVKERIDTLVKGNEVVLFMELLFGRVYRSAIACAAARATPAAIPRGALAGAQ